MNTREFAEKVARIVPELHMELFRRIPVTASREKLTFPQMVIMGLLYGSEKCKMSDISRRLKVTKSAVTGLADRLIHSGLVSRTRLKDDRRVVIIRLTRKGKARYRKFNNFKLKLMEDVFSCLNRKERFFYLSMLSKVMGNLRKSRKR